jgi:hypothetical protein
VRPLQMCPGCGRDRGRRETGGKVQTTTSVPRNPGARSVDARHRPRRAGEAVDDDDEAQRRAVLWPGFRIVGTKEPVE